jgi:hypothetical protein
MSADANIKTIMGVNEAFGRPKLPMIMDSPGGSRMGRAGRASW